MWVRVAPQLPFLDISFVPGTPAPGVDAWDLVITARGDEVIDEVRVESISAPLRVMEPAIVRGMSRGASATFRLHLDGARASKACGVRVTQMGASPRTYDLLVGDAR